MKGKKNISTLTQKVCNVPVLVVSGKCVYIIFILGNKIDTSIHLNVLVIISGLFAFAFFAHKTLTFLRITIK